jgi:hypothetical protein
VVNREAIAGVEMLPRYAKLSIHHDVAGFPCLTVVNDVGWSVMLVTSRIKLGFAVPTPGNKPG